MTVGQNIKRIRTEKKITQKQLAAWAGLNEVTIRGYEAENYKPKIETLRRIADALKVPLHDLEDTEYANAGFKVVQDLSNSITSNLPSLAEAGFKVLDDSNEALLILNYRKLNREGRKEAIKRVIELGEIKKYATPDTI